MITTYTGKTVDPFAIRPEDIDLEDIAHALSMTCRFGGHCKSFYSVAEHSVLVSERCPPEVRLDGLLHDAAEAYLGDIPSPLKRKLPAFEEAELNLFEILAERFGIAFPIPESVQAADEAVTCLTESAAPPRVSESNLVRITPSISRRSLNSRAEFTAS